MKRIISFSVVAAMCFALAACEHHESSIANKDSDKIYIRITNDGTPVSGFGLTYYLGDSAVGSIGMKEASGGNVSDGVVEFVIMKEDFPENTKLDNFGLQVMVTEETGVELSVCTMYFPARFGNTYSFKLINEDGCYAVWSELDGETHSGPQMNYADLEFIWTYGDRSDVSANDNE